MQQARESIPLHELLEHREAARRQLAALELQIVRVSAEQRSIKRGLPANSAAQYAVARRERRIVWVILFASAALAVLLGVVMWCASGLALRADQIIACAAVFAALLLTFVSLTVLTVTETRAVVASSAAVAVFGVLAGLPAPRPCC